MFINQALPYHCILSICHDSSSSKKLLVVAKEVRLIIN